MNPDRAPVIVGIGEVLDRSAADRAGLPVLELIAAAVQAAGRDAGAQGWVEATDWLGVVDALSWERRPEPIHPALSARLAIAPRIAASSPSPSGNYPIRLLEDAANTIAAGEAEVAIVAGGEAMRSFARNRPPDAGRNGTAVISGYRAAQESDLLQRYAILAPIDVYPLYEQATRHAWGQTLAEANAESGAIWAGNARVAADNPYAWIRQPRAADEIVTPSPANPMLSFPYTRLMVANSGVNQAAAVIVTSAGRARRMGIAEDRLVHVGHGAAADEAQGNLERANFTASPAMTAVLQATLERNAVTVADLDHVELYSCFPCVPKMARRVIGWPLDRPHSIYGGLTFGGGPIGNCMTHAVAALVRRLREGSRAGLVFGNGGFATRNHAIVLTRNAPATPRQPRDYDVQAQADAQRGAIPPLLADHVGPGWIESYLVPHRGGVPAQATVVARTAAGARFLAGVPGSDGATLAWLTNGAVEPVGTPGAGRMGPDGLVEWHRA